jgi:small-conductance mechanosensitive channel
MNETLLRVLLILLAALMVERAARWGIMRYLRAHGEDKENTTVIKFFNNGLTVFILTVVGFAIINSIPSLRALALSLTAGAGLVAAAFALASQAALSDIVSGIFIVISKPFRVHDRIIIGSNSLEGYVEDITLRHTVIRDFEHKRIVIPNAVISREIIINSTLNEAICRFFEVPVSYRTDPEQIIRLLQEEVEAHPQFRDMRTPDEVAANKPAVTVRVIDMQANCLVIRTYLWGEPDGTFYMACDLRRSLLARMHEMGIEMPVPYSKMTLSEPIASEKAGQ